ncbi:putative Mo25-like [Trypanosoma cruzi]|nr:putative Mo25-like [Trypanosoma cruzi]
MKEAKMEVRSSKGFLQFLQSTEDPMIVDANLLLLLQDLSSPTEDAISLSSADLFYLLQVLVERTNDDWLEVRKKIAFVFSDLISKGHGDVLADALIYGRLEKTTSGEARASHIDLRDSCEENSDPAAALRQLKYFIGKLAFAHGTVERCVPAADVFRTFMRVPGFLEIILSPAELPSDTTEERTSPHPQPKQYGFHESCIGILCRSVASYTTVLCTETWRSLTTALYTNKGLSASLLLYISMSLWQCWWGACWAETLSPNYTHWSCLPLLLRILCFLRARRKFAESPALLCALLPLTNSSSAHIRFLTFETLKVFIAKGNKPAPIRHILCINRDMLARYVEDYSTKEIAINKRLEVEKQKLLQSLTSLEPLTHEEELLLGI